jgi:rRNA maturation endonuclease Nob1
VLIAIPLLEQRRPAIEAPSPREVLEAEREATVRAIRELDLDFRTAKLTDEDYRLLRAAQVQRGAQILRELDALKDGSDIDAEIEAQVARLRRAPAVCACCGAPFKAGDRFCANCGHPLVPRVEPVKAVSKQE